jgi:hypothetical protein
VYSDAPDAEIPLEKDVPLKISGDRVVMCDVDDTLVMGNLSDYPPDMPRVYIDLYATGGVRPMELIPNQKNINLFIKFRKMGYRMIVWSQTGADWAEAVVKALGMEPYVDVVMSKPRWFFDDRPAEGWMGTQIWRDPLTGKELRTDE